MGSDILIHDRLGEGRLVQFIVPPSPIRNHVDDDIFSELVSVFKRDRHCVQYIFRIISINVNNRSTNHFPYVGCIDGRTSILGGGRITDLIVDDDVNATTRGEVRQIGESKCFCYNSLIA